MEHGLLIGAALLVIGLATVGSIFGSWAFHGFGALAHEYPTAIGFTLIALGVQLVLGSFFLGLLAIRTDEPSRATLR
jgi:hypothetical protein